MRKRNLQNAVTIASVAEILESEISLALRKLVAESLLEFGDRSTHQTGSIHNINYIAVDSDPLSSIQVIL
ncbi:hypothetical protein COP2_035191 [Malus domestica]